MSAKLNRLNIHSAILEPYVQSQKISSNFRILVSYPLVCRIPSIFSEFHLKLSRHAKWTVFIVKTEVVEVVTLTYPFGANPDYKCGFVVNTTYSNALDRVFFLPPIHSSLSFLAGFMWISCCKTSLFLFLRNPFVIDQPLFQPGWLSLTLRSNFSCELQTWNVLMLRSVFLFQSLINFA